MDEREGPRSHDCDVARRIRQRTSRFAAGTVTVAAVQAEALEERMVEEGGR